MMTKHLRGLSTVLLLAVAMVTAGCYLPGTHTRGSSPQAPYGATDQRCYGDTGTKCGCPTNYCPVHLDSCSSIDTDLMTVTKTAPMIAGVNEDLEINIRVTAREGLSDIEVRDTFKNDFVLVKADPPAEQRGNELSWRFDTMECGEQKDITFWVRTSELGCLIDCVTAHALPRACAATSIGKPELTIEKRGPDRMCLSSKAEYSITVRNVGSSTAKDVVVVDSIPAGLRHVSGDPEFRWEIGDLDSNCCRTFDLCLQAVDRGIHCNRAVVTASNTPSAADEVCTEIVRAELDISKSGPSEEFVGKPANYTITVFNRGDVDLTNVVITDSLPEDAELINAKGGRVRGRTVSWDVGTLEIGGGTSVSLSMTNMCTGTTDNHASVCGWGDVCCDVSDSTCFSTKWIGHPGLAIEMLDTCDPMVVGEATCYRIRVTNTGTADDTNIGLVARFPQALEPLSASGDTDGSINGQTVAFRPFSRLYPGQSIEYQIQAKAHQTGDARVKVEMTSDLLQTPVVEEESTYIY